MADWTNLPNAAVGVGGLPSGTTVTALRENPIAIAQGAAGAPRLYLRALERLEAGDQIRSRNDDDLAVDVSTFGTVFSHTFIQDGDLRISFEHRVTGNNGDARIVRVRNLAETVIATFNTGSTSFVARVVDVTAIRAGDTLRVEHRHNGIGSEHRIRNTRLSTGGQDLWPSLPIAQRLEGNRNAT